MRRRDRKVRNRRISAPMLALVLILSSTGLMLAFRTSERPVTEPTPTPVDKDIFSGMGGWIAYGDAYSDTGGIWAMDPERPAIRQQLSTHGGEPLAWSSDGSKLLVLRVSGQGATADGSLSVLNADGSETLLIDAGAGHGLQGSFSPDGSKVVYAKTVFDGSAPDGIYLVDAAGGTPRRILTAGRRWYSAFGHRARSLLLWPTFSPDGSQIAYIDGMGDHSNSLRVMNADGSGSRVVLRDHGLMHNTAFPGGLVWSPDGSRLALGLGYIPDTIYVVGADGSGLTRLAKGADPHWSPDGSRISFERMDGAALHHLVIEDADGTHVQRFNNARSGPWNPLDRAVSATPAPSSSPVHVTHIPSTAPPPTAPYRGAVRRGPLGRGTYEYLDVAGAGFNARFTVPAGWTWHGRYLSKGGIGLPDGAAIFFFGGPVQVYADPCHWAGVRSDPPTGLSVVDLMTALAAQPMRSATTPIDRNASVPNWNSASPASIPDRWRGMAIRLTVPDDVTFADCDGGQFRSWGLENTARSHQGPGQRDLVWAVDVLGDGVGYGGHGEQRLIIDAASFPGTPSDVLSEIEAILGSVAVGHWG